MSDPQTEGGAGGVGSSLEVATKLAREIEAAWVVGLYADAGEAAGTFQYRARPDRVCGSGGPAIDPDRARTEAERRARTRVRRYAAANRLDRLGTLTYAGEGLHDQRVLRRHVRHFFKRLRAEVGDGPFPYLWVPEWHKSGHGLHVHFALGMFVPQPLVADVWGRGFVHLKRLEARESSGSLASARRAAGYLSKYVSKSFDHERTPGLHRYEVAQGFAPAVERIVGTSRHEAIALASDRMGRPPAREWSSADAEDWKGPPAVWVAWDD
jgi:hypothetical protein